MNLGIGKKLPRIKDRFNNIISQTQPIVFLSNHHNDLLQNKPKRLKQILIEKGLWRNQALDGHIFLLEYSTSYNCPCSDLWLNGNYCAQALISKQRDFQGQCSQLQEKIEATKNLGIFYPKFYYKLNFIKRYSLLLILCISYNLTESFIDYNMLPGIMPVEIANIT